MNKDNEQHAFRKILAKGTTHNAPADMSDRVWSKLQQQESKRIVFRPLLAGWMKIAMALFVLIITVVALSLPSSGTSRYNWEELTQPISKYFGQGLNHLPLIAFTSLTILALIFMLNSFVINLRYRKYYYGE